MPEADTAATAYEVFALLDDCDATPENRTSRAYTQFLHECICEDAAQLDNVIAATNDDLNRGLHVVLVADYEFGHNLHLSPKHQGRLRLLFFSRCEKLSCDETRAWLAQRAGTTEHPPAGIGDSQASIGEARYFEAIDAIQAAQRVGDTYQVNFTYRLDFDAFGEPLDLYRRLRTYQPVRYGALIAMPDGNWVLSRSPELFVEKRGTLLRARPMKGTASRLPDSFADAQAAEHLARDAKSRAENLMIVDLLRNDLSRVAQTGSVNVSKLFSIEAYATVWQMTSTIEATLRKDVSFADILRALFPCGSVTGAPKRQTMRIIDALEDTLRGIYTGAIGWLDAPDTDSADRCGDFCLSVAIRTVVLEKPEAGLRRGHLGVGGGVLIDSNAAAERAECEVKAGFLTGIDPGLSLLETMHATRETGVRHLDRHLRRLAESAHWLNFQFDRGKIIEVLHQHCAQLESDKLHRLRLVLSKHGAFELNHVIIEPLAHEPVGIVLARDFGFAQTLSRDPLLRHKITWRENFDRAWRNAEAHGAFDALFFNERYELTEGGRSNVFVKLDGRWYTPPLSSGLLPGVMRAVMLDDAALRASERVLTLQDLRKSESLLLCNAVRGAMPARLIS